MMVEQTQSDDPQSDGLRVPNDALDTTETDEIKLLAEGGETLIAYKRSDVDDYYPIVPASKYRKWLEEWATEIGIPLSRPYHCLPMMMAHQVGWMLLNPYRFACRWDAKNEVVHIDFLEPVPDGVNYVTHMFIGPILTFRSRYIFRTSSDYSLLVRGPSNVFKHGVQAMEGLIESHWMNTGFPINWVFTQSDNLVIFERYEPICMITPIRPAELEKFDTRLSHLSENQQMYDKVKRTVNARNSAIDCELDMHHPEYAELRYKGKLEGQLLYLRGYDIDGEKVENHQTRLNLQSFDSKWDNLIDVAHRIKSTRHNDDVENEEDTL